MKTFYENLMNKQDEKLNKPVDKLSVQQNFTETDIFQEKNLHLVRILYKIKVKTKKHLKIKIQQKQNQIMHFRKTFRPLSLIIPKHLIIIIVVEL